jgi:predicted PurR-regulated permease PerM
MGETARKSMVATSVAVAVVAIALALWHLRVLVALLLLAIVISAAVRPGVEFLRKHGAGKFRELLKAVSKHAALIGYLVLTN